MSKYPTSRYEFSYPRQDQRRLRVSLIDVRAANDIVIHYDFERDGWSIESPTVFAWTRGEPIDEHLEEVAFVPAFSDEAAAAVDELNS